MAKYVLFAFLDCDRLGIGCDLYPSIEHVAWQTGLANSSVRKIVGTLEQAGVLERVGHVASRYAPRGRVARYRFHPDRLPARPPWRAPDVDSRRVSAPVEPDSRRASAPVNEPQPPSESTTAAVPESTAAVIDDDSRRNTPRQPPPHGGDRTYLIVRTDRVERDRDLDRSTEKAEPAAARQLPEHEDPEHDNPETPAEQAARLALAEMTPEKRADLERIATDRFRAMLVLSPPEMRADIIRRSMLRELENPAIRARYGV